MECDVGCCELAELHSTLPAGNQRLGPVGGKKRISYDRKIYQDQEHGYEILVKGDYSQLHVAI